MTATELQVETFDKATASPQERLAAADLILACYAAAYPEDPPLVRDQVAATLGDHLPDEVVLPSLVRVGGQVIGWAKLEFSLTQNLHAAHANIMVHPDHRRAGVGRALAATMEQQARQQGRRIVTFMTSDRVPAAHAFADSLGGEAALPMRQSQLVVADVSAELLERWCTRPEADPYRLHVWTTLPEEYLARAADLMGVMNSAPRGELDVEDWTFTPEMIRGWEKMMAKEGELCLTLAAEDTATGTLAGYTQLFWHPQRASIAYQGATAVRPEYRGAGLGKWLKAAALRQLPAQCPGTRFIRTNNADVNAAMLAINVQMGFLPYAAVTEWQLKLD
ncbi:GNAT family N-acetyltransferase [Deinococcus puniceus]|uniref:Acetyltransferase n=1 Tax=Deinococcus puniceus TaxID=1182568 RepID=A0A172T6T0_9DEIO|nr:GNAT family N-acetyltransferase [Deinococcus puniceus]ANE42523.1 acetyltransferase [Deinococcus puniceus]